MLLTADRDVAIYFEALNEASSAPAKLAANWVISELNGKLNKSDLEVKDSPVSAAQLGQLLDRISDNTISGKIAKDVFDAMWNGDGDADSIIEEKGLKQITDTGEIDAMIDEVIAANPKQLEEYRGGKEKLLGFFVGQVMKASKGKANPAQLNQLLKDKLKG